MLRATPVSVESGAGLYFGASGRQPGSALKPFLYRLAFDRGFTPASILACYAMIALRAGGADARTVHWFVDGHPTSVHRLPLVAGTHVIRASASAVQSDEVRVPIER